MKKPKYAAPCGVIALLLVIFSIGVSRHSKAPSKATGKSETTGQKSPNAPKPSVDDPDHVLKNDGKKAVPETRIKLTPELASLKIEETRKIKDLSRRAWGCAEIIRELCQNGYIDEAWDLIDRDFGKVRTQELDAFFGSLNVSIQVFERRFKELENPDEARSAMNSRLENFKPGELIDTLSNQRGDHDLQSLKNLDFDSFSNAVFNGIKFNMANLPVAEREGRLASTYDLQRKGLLRPIEVIRMLDDMGNYDVFEKWKKFSEFTSGTDFGSHRGYIDHTGDGIIRRMVRESSLETIDMMLGIAGETGSRNVQVAIGTWAELDSRGAFEWYQNNAAGLSSEKQSSVAAGFFGKAYENNELDVAKQWANQISDPKIRNVALTAIENKGKNAGVK